MQLVFEQIRTGGDRNFGYLLGDRKSGEAVAVDPSFDPLAFVARAEAQGLAIRTILNTHGHHDHINGNKQLQTSVGAPIAAYRGSAAAPAHELSDNALLQFGAFTLRILHTPGHAEDHLVIVLEEFAIALTGDLLFVGKVGGTVNEQSSREEWESLQRILAELPEATTVWPGHDYGCRPASTLLLEKHTNPFLQAENVEAFLRLKQSWPEFKSHHGLK